MSKPAQPTLGSQLRADMAIAERRRDDAAQLTKALDVGAQLADHVDRLLAENAELKKLVDELTPEPEPEPSDKESDDGPATS